uniref:Uncharacterized protein n=1 Tax=Sphaerodactylus townsendi TaxID=933632 RepID=A0ACB8E7K1_9SAUR
MALESPDPSATLSAITQSSMVPAEEEPLSDAEKVTAESKRVASQPGRNWQPSASLCFPSMALVVSIRRQNLQHLPCPDSDAPGNNESSGRGSDSHGSNPTGGAGEAVPFEANCYLNCQSLAQCSELKKGIEKTNFSG